MYKPELTEKHRQLARGAGTWVGEETMPPGVWIPEEITAQGRREVRIGLGGFALITDYTQTTDGVVTYEGHGVTVWDAAEECYVMHWFDSAGSPPSLFKGDYEDGVLTMIGSGYGGGKMRNRTEYPDENTMRVTSEMSSDGEDWKLAFEGTYKRAES